MKKLLCITALLVITACGPAAGDPGLDDGLSVVATTGILGDLAASVVGDLGEVEVLIPPGVDPHDFRLSAQQSALLRSAQLVVVNGLGLEEGMSDVLDSARSDGARVLEIGSRIDPIPLRSNTAADETSAVAEDPHFWLDVSRMTVAAGVLGDALADAAPENASVLRRQADRAAEQLRDLDQEIEDQLDAIPQDRRILVTNHESLGYFADRYDFEVVGVVIPGGSTLAEPNSASLADLVATMRQRNVTAIFAETSSPSAIAEAVAAELGGGVTVVELHTEALGGSGVDDYPSLMRSNAAAIVEAVQ